MSINFDVANPSNDFRAARINARQLAAFRRFLNEQEEPNGDDDLSYDFEARICRFPLAVVSSIFDHDLDVLAILEEAQFRGVRVHIYRQVEDAQARLVIGLSQGSDAVEPLEAVGLTGHTILVALGEHETKGRMDLYDLRERLADWSCRRKISRLGLTYLNKLDEFAYANIADPEMQLVWS